jgi:orotidine-5'-phosphate decarboxylase
MPDTEKLVSFGSRLQNAVTRTSQLCVGIDPHPYLLAEWGLPDSADGAREFSLRVLDACSERVAVVKPQVAFFERYGSRGIAVLEQVIAHARSHNLLVIADAKRGDVGTSVEAYGQAWLAPGSPLESDALTVSAFQGFGSLDAVTALAHEHGKGLFVLAATSNPEAATIQKSVTATGETVARRIADDVVAWNSQTTNNGGWGSAGLVIGATLELSEFGLDHAKLAATPILAPGFGHQGAHLADLPVIFGTASATVLVAASRSILAAGPDAIDSAVVQHVTDVARHA